MRLVPLALLLAVMVACAGTATTSGSRTIDIEMRDFAYSPSQLTLQPGERVTLRIKNSGSVEHEFMAGTMPMAEVGFEDDFFKGVKLETAGGVGGHAAGHMGIGLRVAAGATAQMSFTVPDRAGSFEIACFVPTHYDLGMKATLQVGTAGASAVPTAQPRRATDAPSPATTATPVRATPMPSGSHDMDDEAH